MIQWRKVRLGEIVTVKHGYAFPSEFFQEDPPGDILLTPGNFAVGGGFKGEKFRYYRGGPVPSEFVLKSGDLLVTMTDLSKSGDTLGYPALVPPLDGRRFLHNQRLGLVQVTVPSAVDKVFLYYALHSEAYRHEVLASATGSTVRHTSPSRIQAYEFSIPPLQEQTRIATVLSAIDEKIELNRKTNETIEAMERALFKSWFVDFDPVRAKMDGRAPVYMDTGTAALFPDSLFETEGALLPKGWSTLRLDDEVSFLNGLALQKSPAAEGEPFLPVIKIAQLRTGNSEGADRANLTVPTSHRIDDGDLIFSWSGSLMIRLWVGGPGALNQHLFKVTSSTFPRWFVHGWLRHHLPEFQAIAADKATTMGHIQRHHLTEAKIVVPSADVLEKAGSLIAPLEEQLIQNDKERRTLRELRDELLPRLLSGEFRVRETERVVEAAV